MTEKDDFPYAVVDEEEDPPYVVARYKTQYQAEFHINTLYGNGGWLRAKVERGGYGIDGP